MIFSSDGARDQILDRLALCTSLADVQAAGFLFHGTCEDIEGPLHGGGYDGVFWTARTPAVAQAYIPRAGVSTYVSRPPSYAMEDPVRPRSRQDPMTRWAMERAGCTWEDLDVSIAHGSVRGFMILPGWPRWRDLVSYVEEELGYGAPDNDVWEISLGRDAGQEVWKPADWSLPGTLIMIHAPDLHIEEPDWGESDLGYSNHNRLDAFARFAKQGRQAFRMQDLLQSKYQGNVGHEAIGILPAALSHLDWIGIPAIRHDGPEMDVFRNGETADFTRFMRDICPGYRHEPEACSASEPVF